MIRRMSRRSGRFLLVAIAAIALAAPARADERLVYRWDLRGWLGQIASLFLPGEGQGVLSREQLEDGVERSELLITSSQATSSDFFRYGSEWRPATGEVLRAWQSHSWRGERRSKKSEIGSDEVVDVVSAISLLRRDRPRGARRLEIWSDGRLYPVFVVPREVEPRELDGSPVEARHYAVLGVDEPGRPLWKGKLELWIADDPESTPLEILVARRGAKVHLVLDTVEREPAAAPPG